MPCLGFFFHKQTKTLLKLSFLHHSTQDKPLTNRAQGTLLWGQQFYVPVKISSELHPTSYAH